MTLTELKDILEKHEKWLNGEAEGEQGFLLGANLSGADLSNAALCKVDLCGANLYGAYLCGADLRGAYLCNTNLCSANLSDANLRNAYLYNADLRDAILCSADLCGAYLCDANLCDANLYNVNLRDANLCDAKNVPFVPMSCPSRGSFTAWKKANGYIVKLLIPEDARRSSATGRKCRCDKAVVIAIETVNGEPAGISEIASSFDENFVYRVGETVVEPNFCEDRFKECAAGIHFFVNRQEAVDY